MGEFGRGELCGIVETLTGTRRSTTLLAVRDTEIAKIPGGLINSIKLRFPRVVSKLITLLGKRLLRMQQPGPAVLQTQGVPGAAPAAVEDSPGGGLQAAIISYSTLNTLKDRSLVCFKKSINFYINLQMLKTYYFIFCPKGHNPKSSLLARY